MAHLDEKPNHCLNCGAIVMHAYCSECGQKYSDIHDRSLKKFIGELISSFTFADSRFFLTIKYLLISPGRLTIDYLSGKKRRYMSPLGLFLFVNILFFFVSPVSDYSLSLYEQTYLQPYADWISPVVEKKVEEQSTTFGEYQKKYNAMSDNLSKSVIILNIPAIALFLWPVVFLRRKWYYDSFIFTFHFFSFMLISITVGYLGYTLGGWWFGPGSLAESIWVIGFIVVLPFVYGLIAIRRFTRYNWLSSALISLWLITGVMAVQFVYRFVIFLISFIST